MASATPPPKEEKIPEKEPPAPQPVSSVVKEKKPRKKSTAAVVKEKKPRTVKEKKCKTERAIRLSPLPK